MNKDLKFLASILNESNWPEDATYVCLKIDGEVCFSGTKINRDFYPNDLNAAKDAFVKTPSRVIAGQDYQLRDILYARDDLSGKPSWDDVPGWANWLAQDKDGEWWLYTDMPIHGRESFGINHRGKYAGSGKVLGDWRNTLEHRPENHSVEPTEKVWRGPEDGLPPVDEIVKVWFDDGMVCWHDANVIGYHPSEEDTLAVSLMGDHESRLIWSDISGIRSVRFEEDKAVEEMLALDCEPHEGTLSREDFCRKLYRANYRKQEPK